MKSWIPTLVVAVVLAGAAQAGERAPTQPAEPACSAAKIVRNPPSRAATEVASRPNVCLPLKQSEQDRPVQLPHYFL